MNTTLRLTIEEASDFDADKFVNLLTETKVLPTIRKHQDAQTYKLVFLQLPIQQYKILNHWLIDQTTEEWKPTLRDAWLTLKEM